jgi:hypothetical protein
LKGTLAQIQLIPGEPAKALAQVANSLGKVDLLLISVEQGDAALDGAWFYLPRMLHDGSIVFRDRRDLATGATKPNTLDHVEIQTRAGSGRRRAA